MKNQLILKKVVKEVRLIPEDRLSELYDFVHYFRLGVESCKSTPVKKNLQFAGSWDDMPKKTFDNFLEEINSRRSHAFKKRRNNEAGNA